MWSRQLTVLTIFPEEFTIVTISTGMAAAAAAARYRLRLVMCIEKKSFGIFANMEILLGNEQHRFQPEGERKIPMTFLDTLSSHQR